jgi:hypothetical protein
MKKEIEMADVKNFSVNPVKDELVLLKHRLRKLLQSNVVEVNFTKRDGTERKMLCTLDTTRMPEEATPEGTGLPNLDVLPVWDIEKKAWRSFRLDSVHDFMTLRSEV